MSSPVRSGSRAAFSHPNPRAVRAADQLDDAISSEISRSPFDIPRDTWTARLFSKICGRGLGRLSGLTEAKILDWTYNRENSARLLRRFTLKANPIPTVQAHCSVVITLIEGSPHQGVIKSRTIKAHLKEIEFSTSPKPHRRQISFPHSRMANWVFHRAFG